MSGAGCILLLPARKRLRGELAVAPCLQQIIAKGEVIDATESGELGQLTRIFDIAPLGLPAAALSRHFDAGDAGSHVWLRADPAFVQPEMNGVRLMAVGELGLRADESRALVEALQPLFGDAGMPLTATTTQRWYLQLQTGLRMPRFAAPEEAIGTDLGEHLPQGEDGKRWRALLNEAQVVLHNHPLNQARVKAGKVPANSLWFWGAGSLPDEVISGVSTLYSHEPHACALAQLSGIDVKLIDSDVLPGDLDDCALDLRGARDLSALETSVFAPLLARVKQGKLHALTVDFADSHAWVYRRRHALRFWRRSPRDWA
jgi:hypothetical protein